MIASRLSSVNGTIKGNIPVCNKISSIWLVLLLLSATRAQRCHEENEEFLCCRPLYCRPRFSFTVSDRAAGEYRKKRKKEKRKKKERKNSRRILRFLVTLPYSSSPLIRNLLRHRREFLSIWTQTVSCATHGYAPLSLSLSLSFSYHLHPRFIFVSLFPDSSTSPKLFAGKCYLCDENFCSISRYGDSLLKCERFHENMQLSENFVKDHATCKKILKCR